MLASGPISAPRSTRAVESIDVIDLSNQDHGADFGLGDHLTRHPRLAAIPPHVLFSGLLRHVIFDGVARYDRFAELCFVDGEEEDRFLLAHPFRQRADDARGLRHALDHQHAREHRIAWKVPDELWLVHRDVLDPGAALIATDIDDPINHQERVAMRQRLEDLGNVGRLESGPDVSHSGVLIRLPRPGHPWPWPAWPGARELPLPAATGGPAAPGTLPSAPLPAHCASVPPAPRAWRRLRS